MRPAIHKNAGAYVFHMPFTDKESDVSGAVFAELIYLIILFNLG
jgi:hypothetical protein